MQTAAFPLGYGAGSRGRDRTCTISVNSQARFHYATLECCATALQLRDLDSNQDVRVQRAGGYHYRIPESRKFGRQESNLHSAGQSRSSCQFDDARKMERTTGLEPVR